MTGSSDHNADNSSWLNEISVPPVPVIPYCSSIPVQDTNYAAVTCYSSHSLNSRDYYSSSKTTSDCHLDSASYIKRDTSHTVSPFHTSAKNAMSAVDVPRSYRHRMYRMPGTTTLIHNQGQYQPTSTFASVGGIAQYYPSRPMLPRPEFTSMCMPQTSQAIPPRLNRYLPPMDPNFAATVPREMPYLCSTFQNIPQCITTPVVTQPSVSFKDDSKSSPSSRSSSNRSSTSSVGVVNQETGRHKRGQKSNGDDRDRIVPVPDCGTSPNKYQNLNFKNSTQHQRFEKASNLYMPPIYPPHFMKGSIIQLANGQLKRVEEMKTEDFIDCTKYSNDLKIDSSTVINITRKNDTATLSFSVGEQRIQVTVEATYEHPFYVFGQGWSSCSPEKTFQKYGLRCKMLVVGDVCISLTHKMPSESSGASIHPSPAAQVEEMPKNDVRLKSSEEQNDRALDESYGKKRRWSAPDDVDITDDNLMS